MLPKGSTLKSDLTCKLDQVAQGFVHACSEYHQGWGFHDWSEPLFQCLPTLTMISTAFYNICFSNHLSDPPLDFLLHVTESQHG